jgi:c-di-GMP-binding flagellar brake protein YcgR
MRAARVTTPELEVRVGTEFGRLVDISATGALVRTHAALQLGYEYPLLVNSVRGPVSLAARVVRAVRLPHTQADREEDGQQLIGLQFTQLSARAKRALQDLCVSMT